jgi:hypothetical protein
MDWGFAAQALACCACWIVASLAVVLALHLLRTGSQQ